MLCVVCCVVFVVCSLLSGVCCLVFVGPLFVVRSLCLFGVLLLLCVVCYVLFGVWCVVFVACRLRIARCLLRVVYWSGFVVGCGWCGDLFYRVVFVVGGCLVASGCSCVGCFLLRYGSSVVWLLLVGCLLLVVVCGGLLVLY